MCCQVILLLLPHFYSSLSQNNVNFSKSWNLGEARLLCTPAPQIVEEIATRTIGSYVGPVKRTGSPSYICLGESLCPAGRVARALACALLPLPRKAFAKSWDSTSASIFNYNCHSFFTCLSVEICKYQIITKCIKIVFISQDSLSALYSGIYI